MQENKPDLVRDSLTVTQKRAFGPALRLLDLPSVRDVLIHSAKKGSEAWVDQGNGLTRVAGFELSHSALSQLAIDLIASGGRHLDELSPCTDVQMGNGIRVHAVLAPIVAEGASISVRIPSRQTLTLIDLFRGGLGDTHTAKLLLDAVNSRKNILIAGATASGKTTLLSALLSEVSDSERIISIEDVAELRTLHPHHISLESRQPNSEGIGEVTLEKLLREALRMRPDRIVLGECRGAEVVTLMTAFNTGHDGGASTLHANSAEDIQHGLKLSGR